jgi:hypothetical protein
LPITLNLRGRNLLVALITSGDRPASQWDGCRGLAPRNPVRADLSGSVAGFFAETDPANRNIRRTPALPDDAAVHASVTLQRSQKVVLGHGFTLMAASIHELRR